MLQLGPSSGLKLVRRNDRREMRRAVRFDCTVVRMRDFRVVAHEAHDLSPNGMLVTTDRDLILGESMIVSFRATKLGLWFDTEATVARVIKGRRPGDQGPAIGLSFSTLDRVKRLILRGHLRRVPPPLPRRTQRINWTATIRSLA